MGLSIQTPLGRQQVAALVGLVALAGTVTVGFAAARPARRQASPTFISTRCDRVTIYSGTEGLASWRYGKVVEDLINGAGPTSQRAVRFDRTVQVEMYEDTDGSIDNINKLAEAQPNPDCRVAFAQMNVAADAVEEFDVFKGQPVPDLRAVGPLALDILHVMVRGDSSLRDAANLCGLTVSTYPGSGAAQMLRLLEKNSGNPNGCDIREKYGDEGLDVLDHPWDPADPESVAAVVWASSGVPNKTLAAKAKDVDIRLLPVDDFKRLFQKNFDEVYGALPERGQKYYPGKVFEDVVIEDGYYQGVPRMPAFGVPSGLVVRAAADSGMVRFLTQALSADRRAFQQALFGEDTAVWNEQSFPGREIVSQNPLFCYVQPHAASEEFYRKEAAEGGYTFQGQCGA